MTRTEPPSMLSAYERTKPVCSRRSRPELPPSAAAVPLTSPSTPRLSKYTRARVNQMPGRAMSASLIAFA